MKKISISLFILAFALIGAGCNSTSTKTTSPVNTNVNKNTNTNTKDSTNATTDSNVNTGVEINENTNDTNTTPTNSDATTSVQLYFVALEDAGKSGELIGCGDSLVAVEREVGSSSQQVNTESQQLDTSITELLSIKDEKYGESGLYNALYQSTLSVESAAIDTNGKATIKLTGEVKMGGVCDQPRVEEQLKATAMQFSTVKSTEFFLNGTPLHDALSQK